MFQFMYLQFAVYIVYILYYYVDFLKSIILLALNNNSFFNVPESER